MFKVRLEVVRMSCVLSGYPSYSSSRNESFRDLEQQYGRYFVASRLGPLTEKLQGKDSGLQPVRYDQLS